MHQMRVTIRTIRSLLQASASAFGLTDDAGSLMSFVNWPRCWAPPATRRCWPIDTSEPSTNCPEMSCAVLSVSGWSMGPTERYRAGLRGIAERDAI